MGSKNPGARSHVGQGRGTHPALLVLGALVLLLSACTPVADRIVVTLESDSNVELLAKLDGTLGVGDDGCVALEHADGVALAVLPHGSRLEGEDVVLPDGTRVPLGKEFAGHGGWFAAEELPTLDVPRQCSASTLVLISGAD